MREVRGNGTWKAPEEWVRPRPDQPLMASHGPLEIGAAPFASNDFSVAAFPQLAEKFPHIADQQIGRFQCREVAAPRHFGEVDQVVASLDPLPRRDVELFGEQGYADGRAASCATVGDLWRIRLSLEIDASR